ncbi:MAG TPA: hypothetical protein VGO78_26430 [Acidimicrobiales bacterium]|nr:hypothetical protein [Acidimicrobiales bacterium]
MPSLLGHRCQLSADSDKRGEGLTQLVVSDLLGLDVEPLEDRLVQRSAAFVREAPVHISRIVQ